MGLRDKPSDARAMDLYALALYNASPEGRVRKNTALNRPGISDPQFVLKAIEQGEKPWVRDEEGRSAYWYAAASGNLPVLRMLLRVKPKSPTNFAMCLSARDDDGISPMTKAAFLGHLDIMKALREAGASPHL